MRYLSIAALLALGAVEALGLARPLLWREAMAAAPPVAWAEIPLPGIAGETLAPEKFDGKVVLVVNTASFCGFTKQYAGLQALWREHRDRGLVVLGVPSNDFGNQEPGSNQEIKEFCEVNFDIDFPLLARQTVRGAGAHPFYRWAAAAAGPAGLPRWNFHKYLVGRDGRLAGWFSSTTAPDSPRLAAAIEAALAR